jgi:probable addiction module antidote protein
MPKRTRPYRDSLLEHLTDPGEASAYLNAAFEDSEEMFLIALRDVAESSQMARIAAEAGVARETMYRMLRRSGNPTYSNLIGVLRAVGLRMCIAPLETQSSASRARHDYVSSNAAGRAGSSRHQRHANSKGRREKSVR